MRYSTSATHVSKVVEGEEERTGQTGAGSSASKETDRWGEAARLLAKQGVSGFRETVWAQVQELLQRKVVGNDLFPF